jgi:hypothetical protein
VVEGARGRRPGAATAEGEHGLHPSLRQGAVVAGDALDAVASVPGWLTIVADTPGCPGCHGLSPEHGLGERPVARPEPGEVVRAELEWARPASLEQTDEIITPSRNGQETVKKRSRNGRPPKQQGAGDTSCAHARA